MGIWARPAGFLITVSFSPICSTTIISDPVSIFSPFVAADQSSPSILTVPLRTMGPTVIPHMPIIFSNPSCGFFRRVRYIMKVTARKIKPRITTAHTGIWMPNWDSTIITIASIITSSAIDNKTAAISLILIFFGIKSLPKVPLAKSNY
jgi:hypothetical protein